MRIWIWRGFLGLSLLWLAGCEGNVPRENQAAQEAAGPAPVPPLPIHPRLKIAVVLPQSGPNAQLGKAMLNAAILANYDIHNRDITLIPFDQTTVVQNPEPMKAAGANAIVGPLTAAATERLKPFAKANHIRMFSLSNNPSLSDDNTIVMGYRVETEVVRIINYVISHGHQHILAIIPNDAYGDAITAALPVNNIQVIRFSNADEIAPALKTISVAPDAVFLPVSGKNLPIALSALTAAGITHTKAQYFSTGLWDDPLLWQVPELDGAWYPAADPMQLAKYDQRYQKQYGAQPPRLSALSYNAVAMIAILEKQSASTGPFDPVTLTSTTGFEGVDGLFRIMPNGSVRRALAVVEIRQHMPLTIQPPPDSAALSQ